MATLKEIERNAQLLGKNPDTGQPYTDQDKENIKRQWASEDARNAFVNMPDDERLKFEEGVQKAIPKKLKSLLGREPTPSEIQAISSQFSGNAVMNALAEGQRPAKITPDYFLDVNIAQIPDLERKVSLLEQANLTLGEDVPLDVASRIFAPGTALDSASGLIGTFVKSRQEGRVKEELDRLPGEQTKAIDQLEGRMQQSNRSFFDEVLAPSIVQNLNARGLIHSGELSSSLATAGAGLQRGIQDITSPLRAETSLGSLRAKTENTLRGALESGRSLSDALSFTRNLNLMDRQQQFQSAESNLNRSFQSDLFRQQQALQMALAGGGQQRGGFDAFLEYGLPAIATIGGAALAGPAGSAGANILSKLFTNKK